MGSPLINEGLSWQGLDVSGAQVSPWKGMGPSCVKRVEAREGVCKGAARRGPQSSLSELKGVPTDSQ